MGRDATPKEYHQIDLRLGLIKKASIDNHNGKEKILYQYNPRFPQLNFLLEGFEKLVVHDKYDLVEKRLEEIIDNTDRGIKIKPQDKLTETLLLWYEGKLDQDFYYNNTNNNRLIEFLQKGEY